jgi:hypothetical protein
MKHSSWAINVTGPGDGGWWVAQLLSDTMLPVGGGTVQFRVEGFTTAGIRQWQVRLLPAFNLASTNFSDAAQLAAVNASMVSGFFCTSVAAASADAASCRAPPLPPGAYLLAVTVAGATHILLPNMLEPEGAAARGLLTSTFGLWSVQPPLGSIGGGTTVTLLGEGFRSLVLTTAVVLIKVCARAAGVFLVLRACMLPFTRVPWLPLPQVPVSSTFLNSQAICDMANITLAASGGGGGDSLTCVTRAHLATDASSDDPLAGQLEARDTPPG